MKKRIAGLCMTLALVFGMSMGVYAADTPVATFDGSGQIKYNYDYKEDFGDAFEGMLPGDERTQQIILRNTSEKPTDFYMEVEVIKALEEASKASGAAYTFSLTVTQVGVNEGIPQVEEKEAGVLGLAVGTVKTDWGTSTRCWRNTAPTESR